MEAHKISAQILRHRLNADYYAREALDNENRVRRFGCVALGTKFNHADSGYGVLPGSEEYLPVGTGVGLVRGGDLQSGAINPPGVYAPVSYRTDWTALQKDDVLLLIKGACIDSPEGVGLVGDAEIGRIFNGSCYRIRTVEYDSGFLVAYCLTTFFLIQKRREIANTGISYNDEGSIYDYLVPNSSLKVQTYVGDKVRQAERLRAFAKTLQTEAEIFFSLIGMDAVRIGEFKAYRAAFPEVGAIRLDPKFYDPGHFKLRELLRPHQPVSIRQLASPVSIRWARDEPEFFYLEIGELDLGSGLVKPTRVSTVDAPSRATTLVQPGDVLVSTVRPNRKNVGLVMEVEETLPIVASSGFSVFRFPSLEEAAFYLFWFRSDAATMQLMRWDAGSSYPAIDESVPLKVLAPRYTAEVVREKGSRWHQSFHAQVLVERLTTAAKLVVEALIEGKLTEEDVIIVQEALERGDDSADRALLHRLTRQGIDVHDQPPLFPDLDALYTLLAETRKENP